MRLRAKITQSACCTWTSSINGGKSLMNLRCSREPNSRGPTSGLKAMLRPPADCPHVRSATQAASTPFESAKWHRFEHQSHWKVTPILTPFHVARGTVDIDMASGATRRQRIRGPSTGHLGAPRSGRGGRRFKSCHSDQDLAQSDNLCGTLIGTETLERCFAVVASVRAIERASAYDALSAKLTLVVGVVAIPRMRQEKDLA